MRDLTSTASCDTNNCNQTDCNCRCDECIVTEYNKCYCECHRDDVVGL